MSIRLFEKKILLGVTGGIAAYKSAELIRRLRDHGAEIRVVMTDAARAFITPLTMQAVSGHAIYSDLETAESAMEHIELARWADLVLIAPASANFIARLTYGLANDLLSTLCLATTAPIFLAPAMNQHMWHNIATQHNCALLQHRGITLLGPDAGSQACGDVGLGRMLEPDRIITALTTVFHSSQLAQKKILITAGPTHEAIDPVRYLTNHSSGKMGYALATAAQQAGANVTLISGPVHLPTPPGVKRIDVIHAIEMYETVLNHIHDQNIFIAAAAVADYRYKEIQSKKIKKQSTELMLSLERNPDILADVAKRAKHLFTVGFAAETHDVLAHAQQKLRDKKINMIIANQVGITDNGFESDTNAVTVLYDDEITPFDSQPKQQLARKLIHFIGEKYAQKYSNQTA